MRVTAAARIAAILGTALFVACTDSDPGDPNTPAATGIRVTVVTEGSAPDPDGYLLSVDGGPGQRVGVNTAVSLDDLVAGSHQVVISDLAANCRVSGAHERTVAVEAGQTASVEFTLVCSAPSGTVRVEIRTSGGDTDGDGYMVSVSGSRPVRVLSNAWIEVEVESGERSVAVTGVAPNCAASASNPSTVLVLASQVVELRLEFTCTAITGAVQLVIESSGGAIDPDGYQILMEGLPRPTEVEVNRNVVFTSLLAGSRSITLNGVQANCEVEGGATRAVDVRAADTVVVRFVVRCTAFARLTVTTTTTGSASGPDWYARLASNNNASFTTPVPKNGSVIIEVPFAGEYSVSLEWSFAFCSRPPSQTVIIDTAEVPVTFAVTCVGRPRTTP